MRRSIRRKASQIQLSMGGHYAPNLISVLSAKLRAGFARPCRLYFFFNGCRTNSTVRASLLPGSINSSFTFVPSGPRIFVMHSPIDNPSVDTSSILVTRVFGTMPAEAAGDPGRTPLMQISFPVSLKFRFTPMPISGGVGKMYGAAKAVRAKRKKTKREVIRCMGDPVESTPHTTLEQSASPFPSTALHFTKSRWPNGQLMIKVYRDSTDFPRT